MQEKIKVLHLLNTRQFSGAENVICQIIDLFKNTEFEMIYCSPDGQIRKSLEERQITYLPLNKLDFIEVSHAIRKFNPDIIHAHDIRASIIAARFSKNRTIVSQIHGNHEDMRGITLKSLLFRWVSHKFSKIIWVSNSALQQYKYKKAVISHSVVLPNIINIDALYARALEDKKTYSYDVVFIGRLSYAKNPKRLIDVLKIAVDKIPDLKIAVIGNGELEDEIKEYTNKTGLRNIDFLGFVANPAKILQDAKVLIMTSIFEGTPMCALEAMALGIPIVSTPTDGLIDLVKEGHTGFLSNDNEVLADRIKLLVTNEKKRTEMSALAKSKALVLNNISNYKDQLTKVYLQK